MTPRSAGASPTTAPWRTRIASIVTALVVVLANEGNAQTRVLEIAYTPTKRAQIAVWIEALDGTFLGTIMLTEAVGLRGIGNRPGALQMNSGFRWPYGRREGVLPIWAHRRANAPGALQFPRVVFQDRREGRASQTAADNSPDPFYCLSFNDLQNDDVDTVTCASVFNSDKGRYITPADITNGYSEPYEDVPGTMLQRALSATSLYPMRRDIEGGVLFDTADTTTFGDRDREVMPDIDMVTRATSPADTPQLLTYSLPTGWPEGDYVVFVEVNTERDFNETFSEAARPTPTVDPEPLPNPPYTASWDFWATYGFAYRGQPSIVYRVPIHLDGDAGAWTTETAAGFGELEGRDGDVRSIDATITDDPAMAPGSGVDRLRLNGPARVAVSTNATAACAMPPTVPATPNLVAHAVDDEAHSHEWADVTFAAIAVDGMDASNYQVKFSTRPITNDTEFVRAEDAKAASTEIEGLTLCPIDASSGRPDCPTAGTSVALRIGRLTFSTRYYVAIRATGPCGTIGPIASAEFETTAIHFTTVAPCFVATAAYGSSMADDVKELRRFRNDVLMQHAPGRAFVSLYYALGPALARAIAGDRVRRSLARALLRPFVQAAERPLRARGL